MMEENEYKDQRGMWENVLKTPFEHKEEGRHKGELHRLSSISSQFHSEAKS